MPSDFAQELGRSNKPQKSFEVSVTKLRLLRLEKVGNTCLRLSDTEANLATHQGDFHEPT